MRRPVEAVLDAVAVVSLSRSPTSPPNDGITRAVEQRRLQVCVDRDQGVVDEWMKGANREVVKQLIVHWATYQGWRLVDLVEKVPPAVTRALRDLGFKDTGDKLVLRTACNTRDRRVVSNDRDFFDPRDPKSLGQRNAPVAKLCRERLGVTVSTLKETVEDLALP